MAADGAIAVEVVYARADVQEVLPLRVEAETTAREAIERSGLAARYPELGAGPLSVGIFGKSVPEDTVLREGDRLEIYRPLIADPKQARRRRAARKP
jgi:putative ubiquitin-RnfH superfamily antitoxin RatB of RatAB toxin-antitoxin module